MPVYAAVRELSCPRRPSLACSSALRRHGDRIFGDLQRPATSTSDVGGRRSGRARAGTPSAERFAAKRATAVTATAVTAVAAQRTVLAAWLMPAGAAIGASTAAGLLRRNRRRLRGHADEHACRVGGLLNTAMETPAWRHGADRSSEAIAVCVRRATRLARRA